MGENAAHMVQIRYFAWLREKVGLETEDVELPANIATVADLVGWLKQRGPQYGEAFARPQVVRAALDKVHVKPTAALGTAREIAFFPPVTGG
jgi:molybdopterin synthase sulfur carrier subunit